MFVVGTASLLVLAVGRPCNEAPHAHAGGMMVHDGGARSRWKAGCRCIRLGPKCLGGGPGRDTAPSRAVAGLRWGGPPVKRHRVSRWLTAIAVGLRADRPGGLDR